jgi:NADH:ubiquinone oxidoreductase subunit F (NADH-binding)
MTQRTEDHPRISAPRHQTRQTSQTSQTRQTSQNHRTSQTRLLPPPDHPVIDLDAHLAWFGPLPYRDAPATLIDEVKAAGLTGRGGAAFPVHRKLAAVLASAARNGAARTGRARPIVVGNAAEGEPASAKDKSLLLLAPHLVLDGLQLAAQAVGATEAVLYVGIEPADADWLDALIAQRQATGLDRAPVRLVAAPPRFIAGQESALVSRISGGPARPMFTPPRVFERGVDGRPTLVQNVETLAHLAQIARYGAAWFRAVGPPEEPGTAIWTLRQADGRVEITEAALGTPVTRLLDLRDTQAVLVGGYHGAWLPAAIAAELSLTNAALRHHGASVGAGVLAALPASRCGLTETARIVRYLALESAGQCGPCRSGLPRIAAALADLAAVSPDRPLPDPFIIDDLARWSGLVQRRGACAHPDGTVRLVASALRTFSGEIDAHRLGRCTATSGEPFLPVGPEPMTDKDWR